ncbi:hypothetical protein K504DRAFT_209801 [Pleomassaria siparia CBS 279.74]|uniref:Uncharacterized protein n=1 Tax=Pleomassaria siparia CBS 279.74 TaxID=1314801 RepID=A0A6G1KIN9_9PLEO|nr:hypothetical protein K504DRAFT_209801 [Pleomassaria siparia CBS 279.74]
MSRWEIEYGAHRLAASSTPFPTVLYACTPSGILTIEIEDVSKPLYGVEERPLRLRHRHQQPHFFRKFLGLQSEADSGAAMLFGVFVIAKDHRWCVGEVIRRGCHGRRWC